MANFPTSLPSATPADHGEIIGEIRALAATLTTSGWGTLGYAPVTTNQGSITTVVDLTALTVTVTVGTGRRIRIRAQIAAQSTVNGDGALMQIMEGGTQLMAASTYLSSSTLGLPVICEVILTPTSGSHTYKLTLQRIIGSGTLTMNANATAPAYILVEDIGA